MYLYVYVYDQFMFLYILLIADIFFKPIAKLGILQISRFTHYSENLRCVMH